MFLDLPENSLNWNERGFRWDTIQQFVRKMFGPTRTDDGCWRIRTNQEINDILKGQNIIGFIKKQRLNWLGHVERMAEDNIVQKIKRWRPMFKDELEDLKHVGKMTFRKI